MSEEIQCRSNCQSDSDHEVEFRHAPQDEPKTLLADVLKRCTINTDINAPKTKIEVFRGSCFRDFHCYFNKKWNMKKNSNCYEITFPGEDEGGLRREFYTGIYLFSLNNTLVFLEDGRFSKPS